MSTNSADTLRAIPLVAGAGGFSVLLLNRVLSGAAPVVDAGSSQSRVDVLVIALAATLALTGFQWLALRPVQKQAVRRLLRRFGSGSEGLNRLPLWQSLEYHVLS